MTRRPDHSAHASLVELLEQQAHGPAADTGFTQLDRHGNPASSISFAQLSGRGRALGAWFSERAHKRSRVLLVAGSPIAFAECFFGLLYAGLIPVPVSSPGQPAGLRRLLGQARDCDATAVILSSHEAKVAGSSILESAPGIQLWAYEDLPRDADAPGFPAAAAGPDDVAFLQYTSGSTSDPRGVIVTHRAILANEKMIRAAFGHDESTVFCNWLPLFHDMGLVGGLLQPLYLGIPCYLMTPLQFISSPRRWLEAIGRYGVTTTGGPNFAYDHCVDRIPPDQRRGLDLASWRIAFNGAEPVQARTLRRFIEAFQPHGLDRGVFLPCYGLAEATLLVSACAPGRNPLVSAPGEAAPRPLELAGPGAELTEQIGCGPPAPGIEWRVIDPATGQARAEGEEGELCVAGQSVATHYWSRGEGVSGGIPIDSLPGTGFVRTGDLARIVDGEVYIAGRLKDVIIAHGRNVHAVDIEQAAASVGRGSGHRLCVALSEPYPSADVTLLLESDRRPVQALAEEARELRSAILRRCGIHVRRMCFLFAQSLPRTTSGKPQRGLCREGLANGLFVQTYDDIEDLSIDEKGTISSLPDRQEDAEAWLIALCEQHLGLALEKGSLERSATELGMDSMDATVLSTWLQRAGASLRPSDVLAEPSLSSLAARLIELRSIDAEAPAPTTDLSPAAIAMATMAEVHPGRHAENLCVAFEVPASADNEAAFRRAFDTMLAETPALLCPIRQGEHGFELGRPLQAPQLVVMPVADERALQDQIAGFAAMPFRLSSEALARGRLYALGGERKVLQIVFHHATVDLHALGILVRRLVKVFVGGAGAEPGAPSPLPRHARIPSEAESAAHAAWWKAQFPEPPLWTRLPGHAVAADGPAGRCLPVDLDGADCRAVRALAVTLRTTPVSVMLAAWHVALAALCGHTRTIVQVPFFGRTGSQSNAIGCFVNPLPVVIDIGQEDTFSDVVDQVSGRIRELMQRESYPFMAAGVEVARLGARTPLNQYGFSYHRARGQDCPEQLALRAHTSPVNLGGLWVLPRQPMVFDPTADALLMLVESADHLAGSLEYDTRQISSATAALLLATWRSILQGMATRPQHARMQPSLYQPATHGVIKGPRSDLPEGSVLSVLEGSARQWQALPAVRTGALCWSYGELTSRATRLASHLARSHGVGRGDRVAWVSACNPAAVAAMLALWRIGAVYCPIDPRHPEARRDDMLRLLKPRLVIDDTHALLERAMGVSAADEPMAIADLRDDEAAYIIFTSGSSGKPKPVVVPHRGLKNVIHAQRVLHVRPGGRVLQASPIGFDASLFEVVLALGHGATLVFPDRVGGEAAGLEAAISNGDVDYVVMPPSIWLSLDLKGRVPATVVVAGEACPPALVQDLAGRCSLFNAYGPTEASIWATLEPLRAEDAVPLIGRPIDNVELIVVDGALRPLPQGAPGELLIGGAGVALGYLGDPALTAARFITIPAIEGPVYRSGDRVIAHPDGRFEFLGRLDRQLKLRGVRIEPAEIEEALHRIDGLTRAIVLPVDAAAGPVLLGFAVLVPRSGLDEAALLERLRSALPDHIIPARILVLPAFDVDANGKLDTGALRRRGREVLGLDPTGTVQPLGEMQRRVVSVAERVLGKLPAPVYADADLFALGMHSLNAARLCGALATEFGRELSLRVVYQHRTIAALAEAVAQAEPARFPRELPAARTKLPLTPWQLELYAEHKLSETSNYTVPAAFELSGAVDHRALAEAIADVTRVHPALRTRIRAEHGELVQSFEQEEPPTLILKDLTSQPDPEGAARVFIEELSAAKFDFSVEPGLRAALLSLGPGRQVLALVAHHLLIDGWSFGLVLRDLADAYVQRSDPDSHSRVRTAPEDRDYIDYLARQLEPAAVQQRERVAAERRSGLGVADWIDPFLPDAPAEQRSGTLHLSAEYSGERLLRLRRASTEAGVTLFSIMTAAFAIVAGAQAGRNRSVVSVALANRDEARRSSTVGNLVTMLPLALELRPGRTIGELAAEVHAGIEAARATPQPPISALGELAPARNARWRSSLLSALIVQADRQFHDLKLHGIRTSLLPWRFGGAKADLLLEVTLEVDRLAMTLIADAGIFSASRAGAVLDSLEEVLERIGQDTGRQLRDITAVTRSDSEILRRFNDTSRVFEGPSFLHRMCEAAVDRTPDAPAVFGRSGAITYAEFDRLANRLAHALLAGGVAPGEVVGVSCRPGMDLVVAVHGVMKSGAAYAAIDPDWPSVRRRHAISELGIRYVVTEDGHSQWLDMGAAGVLAPLSTDGPSHRPDVQLTPDSPAYVLYTSGSTGKPKAAVNTHAGVANRIHWMQHAFALGASDRVLQKTTYTFDVSVWELFWPLTAGASLCTIRPGENVDAAALYQTMRDQRITTVHFVPSALDAFLGSRRVFDLPDLRRVFTSGEALGGALRDRFFRLLRAELHNLYGPTEASIDVTHWPCSREDRGAVVPIGRPISNLRVHILDAHLRPVPIGVPGELCIGGIGVGLGYWGQPELTHQRFMLEFGGEAGSRMYRSGDLARWTRDGIIEYLGRQDDQIKLRGIRIEPAEVMAALHSAVPIESGVVVVQGNGAHASLVAYVVVREPLPTATEVKARLLAMLPAAMVPDQVVPLERIALLPNGKVDRSALPTGIARLAQQGRPPASAEEARILEVWQSVLERTDVGVTENFFDAGGNSILLVSLQARLAEALDRTVPASMLLRFPSVESFAAALNTAGPVTVSAASGDHRQSVVEGRERLAIIRRKQSGRK